MIRSDSPARAPACAPIGTESGSEPVDTLSASTARHSAPELLDRASRLHSGLADVYRDLARHAQVRLDAAPVQSVMDDVLNTSSTPKKMLTGNDLAEFLQVDSKTVRRWRNEGLLPPALEIGGVVRWSQDTIRSWIQERVA